MKNNKNGEKHLIRFDWAIKNILRDKSNFDVLEGFLSELLERNVKVKGFLESESNKSTKDDKSNRVDILVESGKGEKIIIEVQFQKQCDYLSRILYSSSKVISEYMKQGAEYMTVPKIISINIVYFSLGEGKDYIYKSSNFFIGKNYKDKLKLDAGEKVMYGKKFNFKTPEDVYPEYYLLRVDHFNKEIKNKIDEWIYFLQTDIIKNDFTAKGIKKAAKKLDVLKLTPEKRKEYQAYKEQLSYENSIAKTKNIMQSLGDFNEGIKQGKAEGLEEGEKKAKYSVAKNMKASKIATNEISRMTGLTIQEIEKL